MAAPAAAAADGEPFGPDPEWRRIEAEAAVFATHRKDHAAVPFRAEYGEVKDSRWSEAFKAYIHHTYPGMAAKYGRDIQSGYLQAGNRGSLLEVSAELGEARDRGTVEAYIESERRSHKDAVERYQWMAKEDAASLLVKWTAKSQGYQFDKVDRVLWTCSPTRVGWKHRMEGVSYRFPGPDVPAGALQYALERISTLMLRAVSDRMKSELAKIPPSKLDVYRRVMAGETVAGFNDWGDSDFNAEHEAEEKLSLIPRIADIQPELDRRTMLDQQRRDHASFMQSRLLDHVGQGGAVFGGGKDIAKLMASYVSPHPVLFHPKPVAPRISRLELARELEKLSAQVATSAAAAMPHAHVRARMRRLLDMLDGGLDAEDGSESNKAGKHN